MIDQLEEIKQTFIQNTINELTGLKEKFIVLETTNLTPQTELLANEIFTAMHSISGTAPMVGLDNLALVSRKLEVVFDKIRKGEKVFSEQIRVQARRGIDSLIAELKGYSEKVAF